MAKTIEQKFIIDGKDVRVTFSPQEDVDSDASDFSDDFPLTLGKYTLFSMKNDQTVIGSESLYEMFNMEVGKQVFEESGGVFLQDDWFAVLMLPTRDYPAGSAALSEAASTVLARYVAWNDDRFGVLEVVSDGEFVEDSCFVWSKDGLDESTVSDILKKQS